MQCYVLYEIRTICNLLLYLAIFSTFVKSKSLQEVPLKLACSKPSFLVNQAMENLHIIWLLRNFVMNTSNEERRAFVEMSNFLLLHRCMLLSSCLTHQYIFRSRLLTSSVNMYKFIFFLLWVDFIHQHLGSLYAFYEVFLLILWSSHLHTVNFRLTLFSSLIKRSISHFFNTTL